MAEPLKNLYNEEFLSNLCKELRCQYRKFDTDGFHSHVLNRNWKKMELKERMKHISESLYVFLPKRYSESIEVLMATSTKFSGFEYMFFPGFVELFGLNEYEWSIPALEHFTKYSSSEYAVRPFIELYDKKMMKQMMSWANSGNHHVRRLASEGCRPRLPWSMALPEFKQDPTPVLRILEKLKNDKSEYVRKSVANNLNDISKDHPQLVIDVAKKWLGNNEQRNWIVKHGCRTLLKQGQTDTMKLFGYLSPKHITIDDFTVQDVVKLGDSLRFSFNMTTSKQNLGKLRVDYAIDFVRKNGKQYRKIFCLSEADNSDRERAVVKQHSFKKISTRQYYSGTHGVAIFVNGYEMAYESFQLS